MYILKTEHAETVFKKIDIAKCKNKTEHQPNFKMLLQILTNAPLTETHAITIKIALTHRAHLDVTAKLASHWTKLQMFV